MTTKRKPSPFSEAILEMAEDQHRVGVMDDATYGKITLRHSGQLYSIGVGRTHTGTHVLVLVQDLDIRIINAATGELLRELVLDPTQRYQRLNKPPGPTPKKNNP